MSRSSQYGVVTHYRGRSHWTTDGTLEVPNGNVTEIFWVGGGGWQMGPTISDVALMPKALFIRKISFSRTPPSALIISYCLGFSQLRSVVVLACSELRYILAFTLNAHAARSIVNLPTSCYGRFYYCRWINSRPVSIRLVLPTSHYAPQP